MEIDEEAQDQAPEPAEPKDHGKIEAPPTQRDLPRKAGREDRARPPQHNDPFRAYHAIVAFLALVGALAGIADFGQLLHYLQTRSAIEESGLVACATIAGANFWYYLTILIRWIMRIIR